MAIVNYGFIHSERPNRRKYTPRSPLRGLTKIKYLLKTRAPLHVGNGLVYEKDENIGKDVMRNNDGTPIIPGSTLKGVTRSNFNLILKKTCTTGQYQCKFGRRYKNICKTCDLFGTTTLGSRIRFQDAFLTQNGSSGYDVLKFIKIPHLMEPQVSKKYHQKYYYNIEFDPQNTGDFPIWVVPSGINFKGIILIENCTKFELEVLFLALQVRPEILIGGGKNLGLGRCLVDLENSYFLHYDGLANELDSETQAREFFNDWDWRNDNAINGEAIEEIRNSCGEPYRL